MSTNTYSRQAVASTAPGTSGRSARGSRTPGSRRCSRPRSTRRTSRRRGSRRLPPRGSASGRCPPASLRIEADPPGTAARAIESWPASTATPSCVPRSCSWRGARRARRSGRGRSGSRLGPAGEETGARSGTRAVVRRRESFARRGDACVRGGRSRRRRRSAETRGASTAPGERRGDVPGSARNALEGPGL